MAKLSLKANPTFKAKVGIPVAGGEAVEVEFTFKHRTRDDLNAWLKESKDDVTGILEMAEGWDLAEPFDKENVELLVQNYIGAPKALIEKYLDELYQAKLKN